MTMKKVKMKRKMMRKKKKMMRRKKYCPTKKNKLDKKNKNPILIGFLFFTKRVAFIRKLCKIVVLDYNRIISSSLRRQGCKQQRKQYHRLVYDTNITIK
ncbi:MAG: hypothetical protein A3C58_02065 [Candidatus Staskawiczbacteria bacterium RIFCSPHIGHO2_02_FULL_34_10]|uniref:Uncharacterized protein n=1 Tax=Candidatus Staskawiczbacteria bacterium RIFCSPHIGHO2_02_FULL_34_10 TaxID=1802205 RepID=A0A1G2HYE6_9BACT|nr:MAG: hypothetical protein A3C58_02065 [Candidatus Staskawiczbacteria bacterium RIFCSPHIGHO2_02_FULL_34_10]